MQIVNVGRERLSTAYHLAFRLFKAFLFLGVLATTITLSRICQLSVKDLIVCCLAFLPTGWGLILVILLERNYYHSFFKMHFLLGPEKSCQNLIRMKWGLYLNLTTIIWIYSIYIYI